MKKAQVSIEMMTLVGILMVLFIILTLFSVNKRNEIKYTEDYLARKDNCLKISNISSEVYVGGDGVNVITKTEYNLTVDKWLLVDDTGISCRYNAKVINNKIFSNVNIENVNGVIIIKNV